MGAHSIQTLSNYAWKRPCSGILFTNEQERDVSSESSDSSNEFDEYPRTHVIIFEIYLIKSLNSFKLATKTESFLYEWHIRITILEGISGFSFSSFLIHAM